MNIKNDILTVETFKQNRPDMNIFSDSEIISAINISVMLLNAKTNGMIAKVWYETDTTSSLFRTESEKEYIVEAVIAQTQYSLNMGNDYSTGSESFSTGSFNSSFNRPSNREELAPSVITLLIAARVFIAQDIKIKQNESVCKEEDVFDYLTIHQGDNRYLNKQHPNTPEGFVATVNNAKFIDFVDPKTLSWKNYSANKIWDAYVSNYVDIRDVKNLLFIGMDNYGNNSGLQRGEIYELIAMSNLPWNSQFNYKKGQVVPYYNEKVKKLYMYIAKQDNIDKHPEQYPDIWESIEVTDVDFPSLVQQAFEKTMERFKPEFDDFVKQARDFQDLLQKELQDYKNETNLDINNRFIQIQQQFDDYKKQLDDVLDKAVADANILIQQALSESKDKIDAMIVDNTNKTDTLIVDTTKKVDDILLDMDSRVAKEVSKQLNDLPTVNLDDVVFPKDTITFFKDWSDWSNFLNNHNKNNPENQIKSGDYEFPFSNNEYLRLSTLNSQSSGGSNLITHENLPEKIWRVWFKQIVDGTNSSNSYAKTVFTNATGNDKGLGENFGSVSNKKLNVTVDHYLPSQNHFSSWSGVRNEWANYGNGMVDSSALGVTGMYWSYGTKSQTEFQPKYRTLMCVRWLVDIKIRRQIVFKGETGDFALKNRANIFTESNRFQKIVYFNEGMDVKQQSIFTDLNVAIPDKDNPSVSYLYKVLTTKERTEIEQDINSAKNELDNKILINTTEIKNLSDEDIAIKNLIDDKNRELTLKINQKVDTTTYDAQVNVIMKKITTNTDNLDKTNIVLDKVIKDLQNANFSNYLGEWDNTKNYVVGDIVNINTKFFICLVNNNNLNPETNPNEWSLLNFTVDVSNYATKQELKLTDDKAIANTNNINNINNELITVKDNIVANTTKIDENKQHLDANDGKLTTLETNQANLLNKTQYMEYKQGLNAYTFTKDLDLQSGKTIKGLPDPTADLQAVNKRYADRLPQKSDNFLRWGGYGATKSWNGNIATSNLTFPDWVTTSRRGEYILILKAGGKELTFNFNLFDGLQVNYNKVVAHFAVPKDFDTVIWGNGNAITTTEITNFWVVANGTELKIKFQNPKSINVTIELWRKDYYQY